MTAHISESRAQQFFLLVVVLAACALLLSSPALARNQVILVIADRLTLSDLTEQSPPAIKRLINGGSIGFVNSNCNGRRSPEGAYVSMSAGSGLAGSMAVYQCHDWDEIVEGSPAGIVYERRMGRKAPRDSVVNISLGRLISVNEAKGIPSVPGALGEALRRSGRRVAVFGNSDVDENPLRPAVTIAMDASGIVPEGAVGSSLLIDEPLSPTGKITNVPLLLRLAAGAAKRADLIVIDFGDTARLEEYRPRLADEAHSLYLRDSVLHLDRLISGLLEIANKRNSSVILVSPLPRLEDTTIDHLSPMVIYSGSSNGSLLTSATTRTPGLVTIIDIAPTILSMLSAKPITQMFGKRIESITVQDRMAQMRRIESVVKLHAHSEFPVLGVIAGIMAVVITSLSLIVAFKVAVPHWTIATLRMLAAVGMAFPLGILIASAYRGAGVVMYSAIVAAVALALVLVLSIIARLLKGSSGADAGPISALPAVIALTTAVAIVIDVLAGAYLSSYSLISTYQLRGYRFYGIGNEYAGVLIGCVMVAAIWIRQRLPSGPLSSRVRIAYALGFTFIALVIGLPDFGADFGGAIAAVVAFGLCYRAVAGKRVTLKSVICLLVCGVVVIGALAALDMALRFGAGSHIGQTAEAVAGGGWLYLWGTIVRKLAFNLQLIGTRQGETALLGFTPFFMLWLWGVQRHVSARLKTKPEIANGFVAVVVGAAAALLFNDSGVVAASFILVTSVVTLLYSLSGDSAS
ncbi:MAG: hypothetical protein Q7N50_14170 [Armatimonadota bacterium]|nr:hypothetical protein [Armatimonadota bacterium]